MPYHHVELDFWGPFEVGDPQGFRYLFGGVDRATGKVFLQPIRAKSEAEEALRAYLALIRAQCPGIELHLRPLFKDIKVPGPSVVSSDRGEKFTTTYGATHSEFDALLSDVVRLLTTPDTPKPETSRIERVWGSRTAVLLSRRSLKRDAKSKLADILGLSHDGPAYRAIKVSDGEVITSAHIKAQPAPGAARTLMATVASGPTAPRAAFVSKYSNTSDVYVDIADA